MIHEKSEKQSACDILHLLILKMQYELIEKIFRECSHNIRVKISNKVKCLGNLFLTVLRYEASPKDVSIELWTQQ